MITTHCRPHKTLKGGNLSNLQGIIWDTYFGETFHCGEEISPTLGI